MTIAVLSNDHVWTYNLRRELLERLLAFGHRVVLLLPYGEKVELLKEMGCEFIELPYESRGMNPIKELKLFLDYCKHLRAVRPDLVLSYTIKPNVYGGSACRVLRLPYLVNVTGLGSALHGTGLLSRITAFLYKTGIGGARHVFFQNTEDLAYMQSRGMVRSPCSVLPGSGVNTEYYSESPYPPEGNTEFIFISRVLREKGASEFFAAAEKMRGRYDNVRFHICGLCGKEYEEELARLTADGVVCYHGAVSDIREYLKNTHCTVLPSYYEGMANALLESSAFGRPVIATDVAGCRETFSDGVSGFSCRVADSESLYLAMEKFHLLPYEEKKNMAHSAREWVCERFDRRLVLEAYEREIAAFRRETGL